MFQLFGGSELAVGGGGGGGGVGEGWMEGGRDGGESEGRAMASRLLYKSPVLTFLRL